GMLVNLLGLEVEKFFVAGVFQHQCLLAIADDDPVALPDFELLHAIPLGSNDSPVGPVVAISSCLGPWIKRRRADSVARCEQPPRDDLRLDLCRAFENAENAGIAKDARDRKLEREAVAAMDLHRVVGIGPGDAGGQKLRHAGLEIAAFARILLP